VALGVYQNVAAKLGVSAATDLYNWAVDIKKDLSTAQTQLEEKATQLTDSKAQTAAVQQQLADSKQGRADDQQQLEQERTQTARVQQQLVESSTAKAASEAKLGAFRAFLAGQGCADLMDLQDLLDEHKGRSETLSETELVLGNFGCLTVTNIPAWLGRQKSAAATAAAAAAEAAVLQQYQERLTAAGATSLADLLAQVRDGLASISACIRGVKYI
jgi:vacuolar-type H+-ATPase subunit I/STV1